MSIEPINERSKLAWMFYDGANSIFDLIAKTILLPWVITQHWSTIERFDPLARYFSSGAQAWGVLVTLALFLAGPLAWIAGRWADANGKRKEGLVFLTALTICTIALLAWFFKSPSAQPFLLTPVFFCLVFFTVALSIYDSMLIDAVEGQDRPRLSVVSGGGWALGYLLSAAILLLLYLTGTISATDEPSADFHMVYLVLLFIAGVFAIFSTIIFMSWPKEIKGSIPNSKEPIAKNVVLFLLGGFFLIDATVTVAVFVTILTTDLFRFTLAETIKLFLYVHAVAIIATFLIGIGVKNFRPQILCITLSAAWVLVCTVSYLLIQQDLMRPALIFLVFGLGILIGTTPAIIRSLYAGVIPQSRRGEYFAYAVFTQRSVAFVGPAAATAALSSTGSYAQVILVPAVLAILASVVFMLPRTWSVARQ